jgi:hypothetical protein
MLRRRYRLTFEAGDRIYHAVYHEGRQVMQIVILAALELSSYCQFGHINNILINRYHMSSYFALKTRSRRIQDISYVIHLFIYWNTLVLPLIYGFC